MEVTINDFVRYKWLRERAEALVRQIEKLEKENGKTVSDKAKGSLPYFPYIERNIPIIGMLHNTARINAIKDELSEMLNEAETLAHRLKGFLDAIPEDKGDIRDVLELYYIDCVGSYEKAVEFAGLDVDANAQIQKIRRFMRKNIKMHGINVQHESDSDIV